MDHDQLIDAVIEERRQFERAEEIIAEAGAALNAECPWTFNSGDGNGGWLMRLFSEAIGVRPPEPQPRRPAPVSRTKALAVFDEDGYTCQHCGGLKHLTIDHKLPVSRGGTNDRENLWTLCKSCNSSKGSRTVEEWLS